jgi:hypothetical protein
LYIIDVSQAVDLDHPHALDFLREDCLHVSVSAIHMMNGCGFLLLLTLAKTQVPACF